ncbi:MULTISPECIES: flotillin family protein [unclassified Nocardioides]|uniref:flotillin family protein n=1 Tax=unclassified Nocardioides TaxID=2615069 RepID=UPI0009E76D29|nr:MULTISPECIES: flotillin family protein [unclassified Nocardioides]
MSSILAIAGTAVAALVILVVAFKLVWRVAEPNEALIISGLGAHGESSADMPGDTGRGFKIVVGRGTAVIPGFQTVRRFYLGLRTTTLTVKAPSNQSIPLTVKGVVVFKVADDKSSIANAARRFLEQTEDVLVGTIHELFAGHLRAIVGGLSVEDMLHNRESLTSAIRSSLADDLGKLGLIVDSLQIQEIDDEVGYINNLGKPQAAAIEAAARIAAAQRDQEATQAEQVADARKAEAVRQSQIEQAAYQADVDKAKAESAQAGPLMQAQARQEVVRAETAAAELDAQRQEKVLNTEVRKPADAEAYRQVTIANAERDAAIARAQAEAQQTTLTGNAEAEATKATGDAEAEVIRAKGLAEAAGIKARADALAENQDAVIAQIIAERYPEIVAAGAQAMANVDNMVVLNGGDGVEDLLAKAMTMGGAGLGIAQSLIASITSGSTAGTDTSDPETAGASVS